MSGVLSVVEPVGAVTPGRSARPRRPAGSRRHGVWLPAASRAAYSSVCDPSPEIVTARPRTNGPPSTRETTSSTPDRSSKTKKRTSSGPRFQPGRSARRDDGRLRVHRPPADPDRAERLAAAAADARLLRPHDAGQHRARAAHPAVAHDAAVALRAQVREPLRAAGAGRSGPGRSRASSACARTAAPPRTCSRRCALRSGAEIGRARRRRDVGRDRQALAAAGDDRRDHPDRAVPLRRPSPAPGRRSERPRAPRRR